MLPSILLLLFSLALALPLTDDVDDSRISCIKGIRVITVRATNVPQHGGALRQMGKRLAAAIPHSTAYNLVYPAAESDYSHSVSRGSNSLAERIIKTVNHCPNQRFALIGYSQGAEVIGNALIGPSGTWGHGLASKYRNNGESLVRIIVPEFKRLINRPKVVAIVQFGDPTFVPHLKFDRGNATKKGFYARSNYQQYITYGFHNRMESYCDHNDIYCASGHSLNVHESYLHLYENRALKFLRSMIHRS